MRGKQEEESEYLRGTCIKRCEKVNKEFFRVGLLLRVFLQILILLHLALLLLKINREVVANGGSFSYLDIWLVGRGSSSQKSWCENRILPSLWTVLHFKSKITVACNILVVYWIPKFLLIKFAYYFSWIVCLDI